MVVKEWHRLVAAVNYSCLSVMLASTPIRSRITYHGAVFRDAVSVYPRGPYLVWWIVVVVLKILHAKVLYGGKVPNVTFPGSGARSLIDLIDLPVVSLSKVKRSGLIEVLAHCSVKRRTINDGLLVVAEIHLVRDGLSSRSPAKDGIQRHVGFSRSRLRLSGIDRQMVDADFAQTSRSLSRRPIGVGGQPDVLRRQAAKVDGDVVSLAWLAGVLGKFVIAQCRPLNAIDRVLDGDIFEPEAQEVLELYVVVPNQHLGELVGHVELVLDPDRLGSCRITLPHVRRFHRVQVVGIQPGAVDSVGRIETVGRTGSRDGNIRNRINKRLDGEAPDGAFEDGGVRRRIDFIDPPVIGLAEFEKAVGIVSCTRLARRTDGGIIDIIKDGAEVHIVRLGN